MSKISLACTFFVLCVFKKSFKKAKYFHDYNFVLFAIPTMIATKLLFWKTEKAKKVEMTRKQLEQSRKELLKEKEQLHQNITLLEQALNAEQHAYDVRLRVLQEKQQEHKKLMETLAFGKNMLFDLMNKYEIMPVADFRSACDVYFGALIRVNEVIDDLHEIENEFIECYGDWEDKRQSKVENFDKLKQRIVDIDAELSAINP